MTRICFRSVFAFVDPISKNNLRKSLIRLTEQNEQIEFWFTVCHDSFDRAAVEYISDIKKMYPKKQIDIVAVIDPMKYERLELEEFQAERDGFPHNAVTKIEYAPRIEGKCELKPNLFVAHSRKVDRWIADQCDIVIVYYYEGVPEYINSEIKRLKKKSKEIIAIYNPGVSKAIRDYISNLDGRERIVLQGLQEGRTYKSLGDELGISKNRVQQIGTKAIRVMFREIRSMISK